MESFDRHGATSHRPSVGRSVTRFRDCAGRGASRRAAQFHEPLDLVVVAAAHRARFVVEAERQAIGGTARPVERVEGNDVHAVSTGGEGCTGGACSSGNVDDHIANMLRCFDHFVRCHNILKREG